MSNEKMRESFKEWAMTTGFEDHHFALRDDGEFKDFDVRRLWEPWKASRAAIEVELPPIWERGVNSAIGQACAQIRTADMQVIESLGLKVRQ